MSAIEITDTEHSGEARWGLKVLNDEGVAVLRNVTPLVSGVASATAKTLVHKGWDAPVLKRPAGDPDIPAWYIDRSDAGRTDAAWVAHLTLVPETAFSLLLLKPQRGEVDASEAASALDRAKLALRGAEIRWVPPEADPAYKDKTGDDTPTKGHPGS